MLAELPEPGGPPSDPFGGFGGPGRPSHAPLLDTPEVQRGGGPREKEKKKKPNPAVQKQIEDAWKQYEDCVKRGTAGLSAAPNRDSVVREMQKDSLRPARPNAPENHGTGIPMTTIRSKT